jgi:hypothetical protein
MFFWILKKEKYTPRGYDGAKKYGGAPARREFRGEIAGLPDILWRENFLRWSHGHPGETYNFGHLIPCGMLLAYGKSITPSVQQHSEG